jgi:hypothetical protein
MKRGFFLLNAAFAMAILNSTSRVLSLKYSRVFYRHLYRIKKFGILCVLEFCLKKGEAPIS